MSLEAEDVSVPEIFVPLLGMDPPPSGLASFDLEVEGRGVTAFDLVRSLKGKLKVPQASIGAFGGEGELRISDGVARVAPPWQIRLNGQGGTLVGAIDLPRWQAEVELRPGPQLLGKGSA